MKSGETLLGCVISPSAYLAWPNYYLKNDII